MAKEIKHRVAVRATPARVYAALMDEKSTRSLRVSKRGSTAAWAGCLRAMARISTGSRWNCSRATHRAGVAVAELPKGTYSIVAFRLSKAAGGRTALRFSQVGVPANDYRDKNKGWRTHYWEPLNDTWKTTPAEEGAGYPLARTFDGREPIP